jgi:DAACS family dicarboxylate/amino acid:cation (Na+ or H+) symporter
MVVCATVGVPPEVVGVVYGVERILDMSRTTLNVCGDLTAAVYVARTESDWDPRSVGSDVKLAA